MNILSTASWQVRGAAAVRGCRTERFRRSFVSTAIFIDLHTNTATQIKETHINVMLFCIGFLPENLFLETWTQHSLPCGQKQQMMDTVLLSRMEMFTVSKIHLSIFPCSMCFTEEIRREKHEEGWEQCLHHYTVCCLFSLVL